MLRGNYLFITCGKQAAKPSISALLTVMTVQGSYVISSVIRTHSFTTVVNK